MRPIGYLAIDCETYSKTDLVACGLGAYLDDPTTTSYAWAYRLPFETTTKVHIGLGVPDDLRHSVESGCPVMAHNALFDVEIYRKVAGYQIDYARVLDTAVLAAYHGIPRSLAGAGAALGIADQKLQDGAELIKRALSHAGVASVLADYTLMQGMRRYAHRDVDAMLQIYHALGELPDIERKIWAMSARVNARGFLCDVPAVKRMHDRANTLTSILDETVSQMTGGAVKATSEVQKFASWMGLASADMNALLSVRGTHPAVDVMIEASRYPRKCEAILRGVSADGRLRHSLQVYGATSGRWAARGAGKAQMHNFTRPRNGRTNAQVEAALTDAHASLIDLAEAQRSLFMAPDGQLLVSYDLSGIEARVLPWLAGDEAVLSAIRANRDLYKMQAVRMGWAQAEEHVTKPQRQLSKVARLALGFAGGVNALDNMAATYHIPPLPPDEKINAVQAFRGGEPCLNAFWAFERRDALVAVGIDGACGRYRMSDSGTLYSQLPSGRELAYANARVEGSTIFYRDALKGFDVMLPVTQLVNNIVQGASRDVFALALVDLDADGVELVHHVHDEGVAQAPVEHVRDVAHMMQAALTKTRPGFEGLPLACEGGTSRRWQK